MKDVLRMIGFEIRNILKSRFLFVIAIVLLVLAAGAPVAVKIISDHAAKNNGLIVSPGGPIMYSSKAEAVYASGGGNGEPISVGGVTISTDNPLYWNIQGLMQQKDGLQQNKGQFTTPQAMSLFSDFLDAQIQFYAQVAPYFKTQTDYRLSLVYQCGDSLFDKFAYEHNDVGADILTEALNPQKGLDPAAFKKKYVDVTPDERQKAIDKATLTLNDTVEVIQNDDFAKFIDISIRQSNDTIANLQADIGIQQQAIADNPSQQENLNQVIQSDKQQIELINTDTIPTLQYRLQKHIVPGTDAWQNKALDDLTNNRSQLEYTTVMSQDDFMKNPGMLQQYGSYKAYADKVQKQRNAFQNNLDIAQNSLHDGRPDMKYVSMGARSITVLFLNFSTVIALFAVLLGGWIISSEFQQGTIRLLMIRPKTRTKILMSKFTAAFLVSLGLYLLCTLLSVLSTGVCFGFSDFAFPNYTVSGPISYLSVYLPMLLGCAVPLLFGFAVAFLLSTWTKNTAVSIAVPFVLYVGSVIALFFSVNRPSLGWIAWTPAPYTWMSVLYTLLPTAYGMYNVMPSFSILFGVCLLIGLSVLCTAAAALIFRRRDIAN